MVKTIEIPIYDAFLYLHIGKNLMKMRSSDKNRLLFGPPPDEDFSALSSYSGYGHFAIFLFEDPEFNHHTIKLMAHEVFHVTHRILEWIGSNFDHEHAATLNGYLFDIVYSEYVKYINRKLKSK